MSPRRRLLRWAGWFAAANAALLAVVGLRYLWHYAALGADAAWGHALVAYAGHLGTLVTVPLALLLVPAIGVLTRARVVVPLGVVLASAGASLLLLDSLVFAENQMHTPLVVRWPGRPPARVARRTSHNDLVPTLLTELFGCANPAADYASGSSLFSGAEWRWLVATSYRELAVIEPARVTIVFPASYEVRDVDYRLARAQAPPREALPAAMQEMGRFYR